ncbi:hypothetical protein QAD02_015974 [Eretmocerus hayati]|uniref:Uncharacterized protein n=1 Tax=Eretmocerus hayati TaxID=131215 RepID=A0ACC2PCK5_9HYME|nr:hypothetical protein QAD02_015974 [Eretmocerus hayati]
MSTTATGTASLDKKSLKTRFCNKKTDLVKLREELRQRCKLRIQEQRQEILNHRRFGVSTDDDVQEKLKEIFKAELNELTSVENYDVPKETASSIEKLINNAGQAEPATEEEKLIVEEFQKLKEEETPNLLGKDS